MKLRFLAERARRWGLRFARDERGIESLEYLLITSLVMVAGFVAWRYLGNRLDESVERFSEYSTSCTNDALHKGGF
jgi:Flp pilus assembly pilin Flp